MLGKYCNLYDFFLLLNFFTHVKKVKINLEDTISKVWVATVFCVARTHLARPDFSAHAHVCAPAFYDGRTPHAHLFCTKSSLEDIFIKKKLLNIWKL